MITLEHMRIAGGIALVVGWLIYGAWWQG